MKKIILLTLSLVAVASTAWSAQYECRMQREGFEDYTIEFDSNELTAAISDGYEVVDIPLIQVNNNIQGDRSIRTAYAFMGEDPYSSAVFSLALFKPKSSRRAVYGYISLEPSEKPSKVTCKKVRK